MSNDKDITSPGMIQGFRLKVVDQDQRWYMVSATVAATNGLAGTLTKFSGTAVNLNVAEDAGRKEPVNIKALAHFEDYSCALKDGEKYFTLHVAIPTGHIDANQLTEISGRPSVIVITQAQAELPFGGSPKAKAQARGKSKTGGKGRGKKDDKTEELGLDK